MSLNFNSTSSLHIAFRQVLLGLLILLIAVACKSHKAPTTSVNNPAPKKEMREDIRVAFEAAFNDGMKQYILGDNVEATKYFEKAIVINNTSAAAFFTPAMSLRSLCLPAHDMLLELKISTCNIGSRPSN